MIEVMLFIWYSIALVILGVAISEKQEDDTWLTVATAVVLWPVCITIILFEMVWNRWRF